MQVVTCRAGEGVKVDGFRTGVCPEGQFGRLARYRLQLRYVLYAFVYFCKL